MSLNVAHGHIKVQMNPLWPSNATFPSTRRSSTVLFQAPRFNLNQESSTVVGLPKTWSGHSRVNLDQSSGDRIRSIPKGRNCSSLSGPAPINHEGGSADEGSRWRCKKNHSSNNIRDLTEPTHRNPRKKIPTNCGVI